MNKIKFWKHKAELFIGGTLTITFSFALSLAGLILTLINTSFWPMLAVGLLCLVLTFLVLFGGKRVLSKVIFSDEGIEWQWLNKTIASMSWLDITDVKSTPHGRGAEDLTFVAGNLQIDVGLTKKMYDAIMLICPIPNIKTTINNMNCFKWFHRK